MTKKELTEHERKFLEEFGDDVEHIFIEDEDGSMREEYIIHLG